MSKCVYLACMAVKIEHNHDILQQCISDVLCQPKYRASARVKIAKLLLLSIETYLQTRKIK